VLYVHLGHGGDAMAAATATAVEAVKTLDADRGGLAPPLQNTYYISRLATHTKYYTQSLIVVSTIRYLLLPQGSVFSQ